MSLNEALGAALARLRMSKSMTQEDFSGVSSRTYVSSLERGLKSPTLDKIEQIAGHLGVHPLTLLTLSFVIHEGRRRPDPITSRVVAELESIELPKSSGKLRKPARGRVQR